MRNALRLFFYLVFLLVALTGAVMGFLTLHPAYVTPETSDAVYFYLIRSGIISAGAAVLLDIWIWARP